MSPETKRNGTRADEKRGTSRSATPDRRGSSEVRSRRERARPVVAAVLGCVAVLFAVLNFDEVQVNWILGTWQTPLIVVIAVSFALGGGAGYLLARRRGKRG